MFCLISSGCVATSNPATVALPDVGGSKPHRMRMVVDLPAPFGPRKPKISPRFTSSETLSTATKSPKRLVKFSMWTAGPFVLGSTRHLLLPHQRDEDVLQRRRDSVIFKGRHGGQLFRRRGF